MLLGKKLKTKKNKSKPKRQRTFTSSEFSLPEDRNHLSLSELFRNDALKKKTPPLTAPKKNRSQKQLQTTKKRTKSKSKLRLDKCETYEVIPYKNSLNSEIVFSNQDTRREGMIDDSVSEHLAIRVNQQYLVDSNRQLRISIKKQYLRKVDAAIKIQKVFRGYLTRRILQKYVHAQQKMLSQKIANNRSESISEHSSYFAERESGQQRRRIASEQVGVYEYSQQLNNEQDSEEQLDHAVYRHHEPIYSHDQISGYLESSEEEDFDQDAFDNHIIFETNEEYIDSRKSSLQQQQPKNKLSRTGHPDPIVQEPPETPTNPTGSQELDLSKTQKKHVDRIKNKIEQEEVKDDTIKLIQQCDKGYPQTNHFFDNIEYGATLRDKQGMMKKHPQRCSEVDLNNIQKLKKVQLSRWQQIIDLVQSQINKTIINNAELCHFMKNIMEISKNNQKYLEEEIPCLNIENQSASHSQQSLSRPSSRQKLKSIKAVRSYMNGFENGQNVYFEKIQHCVQTSNENKKQKFDQAILQTQFAKSDRKIQGILLSQNAQFFNKNEINNINFQNIDHQSNIPANSSSPISSLDHTGQMKRFLAGNIQDEHIEQMLKLREELMKKREIEEMRKLNLDIENKRISQQQFISRLEAISLKYIQQKQCIEKAKDDITKGYKASLKLTKETFNDAKKLGYHLPLSRSLEGLNYKKTLLINDIVIDEMVHCKKQAKVQTWSKNTENEINNKKNTQKQKERRQQKQNQERIHIDLGSDQQSSDLQFTEEQLKRFRKAQPYDIQLAEEIADLGRNVMISEELLRQQQMQDVPGNDFMKTQHVYREIYQIQQASPRPKNDPKVQLITENITEWIIWELAGELLIKPLFSQRLIDKNHFYKPIAVSDKERLRFIKLLQNNFPSIDHLNNKLNQKICPLPKQLLKCMRIDFSQDDQEENSYQQIGKYEFIIGQQICNQAIKVFKQQIDSESPISVPSLTDLDELIKLFQINDKVTRYIQQREKYISNRKNHTKELRWEVLNIEIHCIFDAWNQELIFLRSQKAGYSGIGLNELTLSVRDHNSQVPAQQTLNLILQGKKRLINTLSLSSPSIIFPTLVEEDEDELLDTDSKWIFYADQALSYGLQLVYLIEQQIFSECAKELRKKMWQFI